MSKGDFIMIKVFLPITLATILFYTIINGSAQARVTSKTAPTAQAGRNEEPSKLMPNPEKVLNDVKVYPNPVGSQLNLSYRVAKDANVTIKIMDVLGGEIATLFSKQVTAGDQTNSFPTPANLSSGGIYFVQIIAGEETIVKRISVS